MEQQTETPAKKQVLKGAYVQAWLWVEARDPHDQPPVENPTDDQFRRWAKGQFESEGELEIDSNAVVSRSYEEGEVCRKCGVASLDDGEGFDGYCGSCADKLEATGELVSKDDY